jgi:hypothetical protein
MESRNFWRIINLIKAEDPPCLILVFKKDEQIKEITQ